jgi:hypothetical protein
LLGARSSPRLQRQSKQRWEQLVDTIGLLDRSKPLKHIRYVDSRNVSLWCNRFGSRKKNAEVA